MVLDTSVVVAILRRETGFEEYLRVIADADEVCISAVTLLECQVVLAETAERVGRFIEDGGITIKRLHTGNGLDCSRGLPAVRKGPTSRRSKYLRLRGLCDCKRKRPATTF